MIKNFKKYVNICYGEVMTVNYFFINISISIVQIAVIKRKFPKKLKMSNNFN